MKYPNGQCFTSILVCLVVFSAAQLYATPPMVVASSSSPFTLKVTNDPQFPINMRFDVEVINTSKTFLVHIRIGGKIFNQKGQVLGGFLRGIEVNLKPGESKTIVLLGEDLGSRLAASDQLIFIPSYASVISPEPTRGRLVWQSDVGERGLIKPAMDLKNFDLKGAWADEATVLKVDP